MKESKQIMMTIIFSVAVVVASVAMAYKVNNDIAMGK